MPGSPVSEQAQLCCSCDGPMDRVGEACVACYRDPTANNCERCGHHLENVEYPYICGDCVTQCGLERALNPCA